MSTNLYNPTDLEYVIDSIFVISAEHELIMGQCLTDRIEGFLKGHSIPISDPLPDLLSVVPIGILKDLRAKMIQVMEGSEVLAVLPPLKKREVSQGSGEEEEEYSFTFTFEYEDEDCDDF